MVFDGTMGSTFAVSTRGGIGGISYEGKICANGAPGTLYRNEIKELRINNNGNETDKAVILSLQQRNSLIYPG